MRHFYRIGDVQRHSEVHLHFSVLARNPVQSHSKPKRIKENVFNRLKASNILRIFFLVWISKEERIFAT